ncbi:unnamed protein product [Schistosoma curassoni]|uniref:FLYWCH-type domain-containing protein n=1 Tax=Schistosoma curassoni TaxID=6186 RepID=A0A183JVB9_9TREM|nr:unnamed protein product [Schistosoma curassoni]
MSLPNNLPFFHGLFREHQLNQTRWRISGRCRIIHVHGKHHRSTRRITCRRKCKDRQTKDSIPTIEVHMELKTAVRQPISKSQSSI